MSRGPSTLRWAAVGCIAVLGLGACASTATGESDDGPVVVGSVLDLTGPLGVYGVPKNAVAELAIKDINDNGGVLGRQLDLKTYDSQSQTTKNVEFANQLATKDEAAVVMGGITSASREAMRPALSRSETLYFYNSSYEGGVCDRNVVITGETASQYVKPLVDYSVENFGKTIYVVAADYNYGRITSQWIEQYAGELGAQVVGKEFVSLDSSDFNATISRIQAAKPDIVVSALVGANHVPFYRDYASKGLAQQSQLVSTAFGLGNEQEILAPAEAAGIVTAYNYFQELPGTANADFTAAFAAAEGADHAYITDLAAAEWNGWHLWAAAVEKAGSFDRDDVLDAIEAGGVSVDGPSGTVTIDPATHHVVEDITIAESNDQQGFDPITTMTAQQPTFEQEKCDLVTAPDTDEAFTP